MKRKEWKKEIVEATKMSLPRHKGKHIGTRPPTGMYSACCNAGFTSFSRHDEQIWLTRLKGVVQRGLSQKQKRPFGNQICNQLPPSDKIDEQCIDMKLEKQAFRDLIPAVRQQIYLACPCRLHLKSSQPCHAAKTLMLLQFGK
jgi:hypothetical protein